MSERLLYNFEQDWDPLLKKLPSLKASARRQSAATKHADILDLESSGKRLARTSLFSKTSSVLTFAMKTERRHWSCLRRLVISCKIIDWSQSSGILLPSLGCNQASNWSSIGSSESKFLEDLGSPKQVKAEAYQFCIRCRAMDHNCYLIQMARFTTGISEDVGECMWSSTRCFATFFAALLHQDSDALEFMQLLHRLKLIPFNVLRIPAYPLHN